MQSPDIKYINEKSKQIIESFSPEVKKFYEFHGVQMLGSEMPVELVETLYKKLQKGIYDAGDYVEIVDNEESQSFEVKAKNDIKKHSNLFLVDHALTFKYNDLRKALCENPQMITRLKGMLKYMSDFKSLASESQQEQTKSQTVPETIQLQFDNMQLTQLSHLQFPPNTITLSLMSNQLAEDKVDQIIKKLDYLSLKVFWINDNPAADSQKLSEYVESKTKIEIYNSKFTKHCTAWGVKYAHDRNLEFAYNPVLERVYQLNLDERDVFALDLTVLKKFNNLRSLSIKQHSLEHPKAKATILWILKELQSLKYLYVDLEVEKWLFQMVESKQLSTEIASKVLINKHSLLLQPGPQSEQDQDIDFVLNHVFKIAGCYRLASSEQLDESSTWYINDEVGSMIPHSDYPNVKLIPFLYAPNFKLDSQVQAFSILWPVNDIPASSFIFRDYLNGIKEQRQRSSRLAIWYQLPQAYYHNAIKQYNEKMFELEKNSISVLESFYKQNAISQRQYIAKISEDDSFFPAKHRVISDHEFVLKYLKDQKFEFVNEIEQATVIWLSGAADEEQWQKYKGKYFINQFPFESSLVMKHNLADTIQSVFGDTKFLQRTYNLERQLKQFVADFYEREKKGEDNLWIIKPPNMARSMDMIISDNLPALIKSLETGPKIAQKYITNPVLRQGRKIDLRYVLLIKSIQPLTLFLYKHFWIRSSNNPYTVDRRALATYQTQFTVMNYGKVSDFKQIKYKDFIEEFEKDYSPVQWSTIHDKIKKMLRNTFIAAGIKYPEMQDNKCRAVYGIDVMIDGETMEPKLLEMTFSPDCKRACVYYPTFYNQVFQTLFMDIIGQNMERVI